jgi:transcriptional regulator with XRE-family HTH domain
MKTLEEIFSANLKRFRSSKTQEAFSEELGIYTPTYKRYEAGVSIPQGANREKLIKALDVPEAHLFVDWEEFEPKTELSTLDVLARISRILAAIAADPSLLEGIEIALGIESSAEEVEPATRARRRSPR